MYRIGESTACGMAGPCTPLHLAAALWGNWTPDLLVSHDAASEAVLFGKSLTRGLPWLSLHKVARQVWPGRDNYELEPLSAWLATPSTGASRPSGAAREAELAGRLFSAMYADPGLKILSNKLPVDLTARQPVPVRQLLDFCDDAELRAAMQISALPAPPLKYPPGPWDNADEWADIGTDDLINWAIASVDPWTTEAAQIEVERRRRAAIARQSCAAGVLIRRREPLRRSRPALADV